MNYNQIICEETIRFFIFTIARNLVNDYLRRYYKRQEITSYIYDHRTATSNEIESQIIANDLLSCEQYKLSLLPPQRRTIYTMNRFENKNVTEISSELNLSVRTVENPLFIGLKSVRVFMRDCI